MVRFGIPGQNINSLAYVDSRLATVPAIQASRRPTTTDKKYPLWCEWRVDKNAVAPAEEGEFWKLVRFESNGDATWVQLSSGDEDPILTVETDDGAPEVVPNINGNIQILGGAGINVTGQGPGNTVTVALSGGGAAIDSIDVDFNTVPGTDPVVPDVNGQLSIFGNSVSNGTNSNAPVATHSRAVNQFHVDVQLAAAVAPTPADPYDVGLISVDSSYFSVDGNGFMTVKDSLIQMPVGTTYNLGINYSSPTFKVTSSDGTALSSTNPGYIVLPSKANPGYKIVHQITADISFDDDTGTSDIVGNLFGTTTSVAWNPAVPFYLYGVADDNDDNVTVMISRIPHRQSAPAVGNIGKSGSAVASTQGSFFAIDSGVTVGDYDTNPCVSIGSFRMNKSASDDWTVQTIGNGDGIGSFNHGTSFQFFTLQNGATASNLSSSVGGDTLPTFQNIANAYTVTKDGKVSYYWNFDNITVSGVGAGNLRFHIPLGHAASTSFILSNGFLTWLNNGATTYETGMGRSESGLYYFEIVKSGTGTAKLTPADWTTDKKNGGFCVNYDIQIN